MRPRFRDAIILEPSNKQRIVSRNFMKRECTNNCVTGDPLTLAIASQKQVAECLALTGDVLDIDFPMEYVSRGELLAITNRQNEICGGAILVLEPPFRSLCSIPGKSTPWNSPGQSEIAEVNGVWLSKQMRSPFLSYSFWTLLLRYLMSSRCNKFLFTFDNSNDQMTAVSKWMRPMILYSGRTTRMNGMKKDADETIAIVERNSIQAILNIIDDPDASKRDGSVKALIENAVSNRKAA